MSREQIERDLVKCEDIRLYSERAIKFLGGMSFEDFARNDMSQDAIIRCIEVIGEAARLISENSRELAPEIPWQQIIGIRHVLVHDYGAVNLDKVYEVVKERLPELVDNIRTLISVLETKVDWQEESS